MKNRDDIRKSFFLASSIKVNSNKCALIATSILRFSQIAFVDLPLETELILPNVLRQNPDPSVGWFVDQMQLRALLQSSLRSKSLEPSSQWNTPSGLLCLCTFLLLSVRCMCTIGWWILTWQSRRVQSFDLLILQQEAMSYLMHCSTFCCCWVNPFWSTSGKIHRANFHLCE